MIEQILSQNKEMEEQITQQDLESMGDTFDMVSFEGGIYICMVPCAELREESPALGFRVNRL